MVTPHYEEKDPRNVTGVDEQLLPYVTKFQELCHVTVSDIPVVFSDLEDTPVGLCTRWNGPTRSWKQVEIDSEFWHNTSDEGREWLVFHELGHCVLDKDHNDYTLEDVPVSIMNSKVPWNVKDLYSDNTEYYIQELCK